MRAAALLLLAACAAPAASSGDATTLAMLVGRWEGEATTLVRETGETLSSTAVTDVEWAADGRAVVERTTTEMERMGTFTSVCLWTWDETARLFRTWRVDGAGGIAEGTARYDDATRTWNLQARRRDPETGGTHAGEGVMRFLTADSKTFAWSEPGFEAAGSSRRVR